jgi:hypothetical protein
MPFVTRSKKAGKACISCGLGKEWRRKHSTFRRWAPDIRKRAMLEGGYGIQELACIFLEADILFSGENSGKVL